MTDRLKRWGLCALYPQSDIPYLIGETLFGGYGSRMEAERAALETLRWSAQLELPVYLIIPPNKERVPFTSEMISCCVTAQDAAEVIVRADNGKRYNVRPLRNIFEPLPKVGTNGKVVGTAVGFFFVPHQPDL